MAGDADKTRHFLLTRFHQALQRPVWGFDFRQIVGLAQAVDMDQIYMVGPEPFQASLQAAEEFVAGTIGNLRCQPDFLAALSHYLADASFALAISVGIGRVQIGDA